MEIEIENPKIDILSALKKQTIFLNINVLLMLIKKMAKCKMVIKFFYITDMIRVSESK